MKPRVSLLPLALACLSRVSESTVAAVAFGEEICVLGYVMDSYCIDDGFLLDNPTVKTLEHPEEHSVHCLVDVPFCAESPFNILQPAGDVYVPGYYMTDNSLLIALAQEVGSCNVGCTGTQANGLKLMVTGIASSIKDGKMYMTPTSVVHVTDDVTECDSGGSAPIDTAEEGMMDGEMEGDNMERDMNITTVFDLVAGSADHTTLLEALQATGLDEFLKSDIPFTLFAPTNEAFESLGSERLTALFQPEWRTHLTDILLYHVIVQQQVLSTDAYLGASFEMANGNGDVANITSLEPPMINQAIITDVDIMADNGVVHVIDSVLLPRWTARAIADTAANMPDLSSFAKFVVGMGLVQSVTGNGPFTLFAPTNEAFAAVNKETLAIPEALLSILLYHVYDGMVMPGRESWSNGTILTMANNLPATLTITNSSSIAMDGTMDDDGNMTDSAISAAEVTEEYWIQDSMIMEPFFVLANNGILYKIDSVMIPGMPTE